jgi:hypothetical protein
LPNKEKFAIAIVASRSSGCPPEVIVVCWGPEF